MQRRRNGSFIGALIFTVIGVAFFAVGMLVRSNTTAYDDGITVQGTVIDNATGRDSDGDLTHRSIVQFVDPATGETHTAIGSISTSNRPELGSNRDVSFQPGRPENARVLEHGWFPWLFIGIGAFVGGIGVVALLVLAAKVGILATFLLRRERDDTTPSFSSTAATQDRGSWSYRRSSRPDDAAPSDPLRIGDATASSRSPQTGAGPQDRLD